MKKILKSFVLLGMTAPFFAVAAQMEPTNAGASRPAIKATDLFTNSIVAKGKGVTVSRSLLDEALLGVKAGASARGEMIPPEQMLMLERQILQRLIQSQLLNAKATDADKAAGKELGEQRLAEMRTRVGSEEALEQQLKPMGITPKEFAAKVTEEAVAETVLKRELKADVSADEIKKFYDENPSRFEQPDMVRAAHVLLSTKDPNDPNPNPMVKKDLPEEQKKAKYKQIEDLQKRARSGEDFSKLAKEYSEDPSSKEKGGEYAFAKGQMMLEFESAAFSLNTNQVSDIVTTAYGYHIIKLYEKMPARTATLEDEVVFTPLGNILIKKYWNGPADAVQAAVKLSTLIRQKLEADQQSKQIPDYMEKLLKDADVQFMDENLKPPPAAPRPMVRPPATNAPARPANR